MRLQRIFALPTAALVSCLVLASVGNADTLVYGFDDGTFGDWMLLNAFGEPFPEDSEVSWKPSNETIDIGDGFNLVTATSGDYRVVPDPWANRDCLGGLLCYTQILRSPEFMLDGSGDLTIDMIGGGATGDSPFDPDVHFAPEEPEALPELKSSSELQGFALLDVESNSYVLHGFSSFENDGKKRDGDPPTRGDWETVAISQEDLKPYANDGKSYRVDIFDSYSGGWGWIGFDTVTVPGRLPGDPIAGDVNADGVVDDADMDDLTNAIKQGDMDDRFDVNEDGMVNRSDREFWINSIKNSYFGDANLDGEFNSGDLVAVFGAGKYETGEMAGWAEGDWNGDMAFGSGDLVVAFAAGGYEEGPRLEAPAVPEPSAIALMLTGLLAVARIRRSKRAV